MPFISKINGVNFTASQAQTASLAITANTSSYLNTLNQDLTISGSVTILTNLNVFGSQSVAYLTSSQLDISTNLITVNTSTPAIRFGGIAVRDSGSLATGLTGSLLWDSQNDVWIYSNPSGAAYDGGMLLTGPRNTSGLGNEVGITTNYLSKGDGSNHMTSSQISDNGTTVSIPGNLSVTNGITGSLFGTASWATNFVSASNYVLNNQTSSFITSTQTSSFITNSQTSSFVTNAQTSSFVQNSQTSSMSVATASLALTASFAQNVYAPSFITYSGGNQSNSTVTLADVHSSAGWNNIDTGFYEFEIYTTYNAGATTTGTKLSISGSVSFSYLACDIGYTAATADRGAFMFRTFDGGGTAVSSQFLTNNTSIMQGHINITSTGQLRLRFASEIASSAITVTDVTGYLRRLY
jgi:hypothetical protein